MLCGIIPANATVSKAVSNNSQCQLVLAGTKRNRIFWFEIKIRNMVEDAFGFKKEAFCLSLGHTCHSGNTYAAENSYKWDQDTGGEKHGYYAKIIRWYV